jgi:iron complex transport system substrate-binding protein
VTDLQEDFTRRPRGSEGRDGVGPTLEELAATAIDCGLNIHRQFGPGLLESAYEKILAHRLAQRGLEVATQVMVPITVDGIVIEPGFRADLIVEGRLLIEIKSVERLLNVHAKQVLTYLRLMDLHLGLLMNFSGERFSEGLKRIVNNHRDHAGSDLKIHR